MEEVSLKKHSSRESVASTSVRRKVDYRLLPVLYWLAVVTSLDGVSVGNARLAGLERDLKMKRQAYNTAVLVYFIPTILSDVPANLLLQSCRPPVVLGISAFLCGALTIGLGFAQNYATFVACRFLLGVVETVFQSGAIYLIASYYPGPALHKRMSPFLTCRMIGRAIGGLLAYGAAHMNGRNGLASWRWIFILVGTLSGVSALICGYFIPDWPEQASFLEADDKDVLSETLLNNSDECVEQISRWQIAKRLLRSPLVMFNTLIHFCCTALAVSSSVFLPTILQALGVKSIRAYSLSVPIFLTAAVFAVLNGLLSDHFRRRYPFCVGPLTLVVIAFSIQLAGQHLSLGVKYMACYLIVVGSSIGHSAQLTWLSNNIIGRKARGIALGLVGGIGNCGFLLGSSIFLEREKPRYTTGFGVCLGLSVTAIVAATCQLLLLLRVNKRADKAWKYPISGKMY